MMYQVAIGNRHYNMNESEIQYRLGVLDRYYSYQASKRSNCCTSLIRAVAHIFNSIAFYSTFGSESNAKLFRKSVRPLIRDNNPNLWGYYTNMRANRRLLRRPIHSSNRVHAVASTSIPYTSSSGSSFFGSTPSRNVAAPSGYGGVPFVATTSSRNVAAPGAPTVYSRGASAVMPNPGLPVHAASTQHDYRGASSRNNVAINYVLPPVDPRRGNAPVGERRQ